VNVTLRELADLVDGKILGDEDLVITAARPANEARRGDITFVETERHASLLSDCQASAAVVPFSLPRNGLAFIQVHDPLSAFVTIVRHLQGPSESLGTGIDPHALVHRSASIGEESCILPFASVGARSVLGARCRLYNGAVVGRDCRLGDDVTMYPNAVVYDGIVIGNRVIIHANAVIGADGFGYRFQNGRHIKVPQLGLVEIGDDVEIGACSAIDRGTFHATRIGEGTKIDNLVQIGHNCRIGRHNLLCGQVGIAGSCNIGDYVVMAGQVGVADHIEIGDRVMIGAQSGVTRKIATGERVLGHPPIPERDQRRVMVTLEKLPQIRRDVTRIKRHLGMEEKDEG
jgi:UDP-3-O-[3-hydroxymyristoyl] glucosamine N-acyltransferase